MSLFSIIEKYPFATAVTLFFTTVAILSLLFIGRRMKAHGGRRTHLAGFDILAPATEGYSLPSNGSYELPRLPPQSHMRFMSNQKLFPTILMEPMTCIEPVPRSAFED